MAAPSRLSTKVVSCAWASRQARIKGNPEAALPFMALGAILNANNAGLPPDLDITLNVRHVYRPPFEKPDQPRSLTHLPRAANP